MASHLDGPQMTVSFAVPRPAMDPLLSEWIAETYPKVLAHFDDLRLADELVGNVNNNWAPRGVVSEVEQ